MSAFGFSAGLRALTAARIAMQTAGNNIANANTPGYSRQRVELVPSLPFTIGRGFQIGSGVDVATITRLVDDSLANRLRQQAGLVSGAEVDQSRFAELEGLLGEPEGGLADGLAGLFGAFDRLQADPADRGLRGGVVQSADDLAQGFRLLSRRFQDLAGSTFDEVRGLVQEVNRLAGAIAELNGRIVTVEATGDAANDLRDTRDQYVQELGKLVDVRGIERSTGSLDLLVGGHLLVSGTRAATLSAGKARDAATELRLGNPGAVLQVQEGRIAALLRQEQDVLPDYQQRLDRLARNLILETNRRHSTGMPASGPFHELVGHLGAADGDGDGQRGDELLAQSGLPFAVQRGELFVTVTDAATGRTQRTRLPIDPATMTLRDLAQAIDAIDHLSASVDPSGRLRVAADAGHGFDFSPRLDADPDDFGSFGGSNPSIGSARGGPFDLSGQTFPVRFTVTTGTAAAPAVTTVTLAAADFANPAAATVDELVAAINDDLGGAAVAANVGGRLVLRGNAGGGSAQLALANVGAGTALGALGLSTATAAGQDAGVDVRVEGSYTGADNGQLLFVASGDGQIGVTPGLQVAVFDRAGNQIATLDVGAGYEPGKPLAVGDGVRVGFGPGSVSATAGNVFALDVLADSDTSDVLVALGMNPMFDGSGAADIAVNPDLRDNVDNLAAGIGAASGDAGNLERLIGLRSLDVGALDGNTIEDYWAGVVGDVAFASEGARTALESQDQLLQHLQAERESVSGVNLDEEMVDMVRYQQSFEAASRFLGTLQDLSETLINLGR